MLAKVRTPDLLAHLVALWLGVTVIVIVAALPKLVLTTPAAWLLGWLVVGPVTVAVVYLVRALRRAAGLP